jgi:hypothetical protein
MTLNLGFDMAIQFNRKKEILAGLERTGLIQKLDFHRILTG